MFSLDMSITAGVIAWKQYEVQTDIQIAYLP